MPTPVKLRPHHLLCMLTFVGKGYTPEFVDNLDTIIKRINEGANITIVEGLDDICAALHNADGPQCESGNHCLKDSPSQRDIIALASVGAALGATLQTGSTLNLNRGDYAHLRRLFAEGALRAACVGCEWHDLCSDIAAERFKEARLGMAKHKNV